MAPLARLPACSARTRGPRTRGARVNDFHKMHFISCSRAYIPEVGGGRAATPPPRAVRFEPTLGSFPEYSQLRLNLEDPCSSFNTNQIPILRNSNQLPMTSHVFFSSWNENDNTMKKEDNHFHWHDCFLFILKWKRERYEERRQSFSLSCVFNWNVLSDELSAGSTIIHNLGEQPALRSSSMPFYIHRRLLSHS